MRAFLRRFRHQPRSGAPSQVTLQAIGFVRNRVARPRPHGWEQVESRIEVGPEHAGRLAGIDLYSHIIVVFYMDLAAAAAERPEALTLASGNRYGIFATRSQLRPNHLGVSAVPLLRVEGGGEAEAGGPIGDPAPRLSLVVLGLDAIDGTPVFDIKPYLPEYDAHPNARIPRSDP